MQPENQPFALLMDRSTQKYGISVSLYNSLFLIPVWFIIQTEQAMHKQFSCRIVYPLLMRINAVHSSIHISTCIVC